MENINKFIKFLLENTLTSEDPSQDVNTIEEVVTSIDSPEFKDMEAYYTRIPDSAAANFYSKLSDVEKLKALNIVNKIVNGGTLNKKMEHPEDRSVSNYENFITSALASEFVLDIEDSSLSWKPEKISKNNIEDFLTKYYNPFNKSRPDGKSLVARKVSKKALTFLRKNVQSIEIDGELLFLGNENSVSSEKIEEIIDIDAITEAYYKALIYLLNEKKYKVNYPFDYVLTQMKWPQLVSDFVSKAQSKFEKSRTIRPYVKAGEDDDKELGIEDLYGSSDNPYEIFKNDRLINYILSKLNDEGKQVFNAWLKWFSGEGDEDCMKNIGSSLDLDADDETDYNYLRQLVFRTSSQIKKLTQNQQVMKSLGLEDRAQDAFKILKCPRNLKGKSSEEENPINESVLHINVSVIFENLNFKIKNLSKKLNALKTTSNILKESNQTDVADLGEDINNLTKYAINSLEESMANINELQNIARYIKIEFPEISDKILNYCEPFEDKLYNIVQDLKKINIEIKPYLQDDFSSSSEYLGETDFKKKKFLDEDDLDEERITNPESKEFVKNRENFIGSHIYGEDLGGLGKMYVAYSYGEQFPTYLWFKNKWYHNSDDYVLDDGTVNEPTNQHKKDMRPVQDTHGLSTYAMNNLIRKFKKKNGLGDNVHKDVEPGEKN